MTKKTAQQASVGENPFMQPWNTLHGTVPFSSIRLEHFKPAFEAGMEEEDKEIEAIINNPEPPTFDNTLEAMAHTGQLLGRASAVMGNLLSAETSDGLESLAQELIPALTEHQNRISLNTKLFERIKKVYEDRPKLEPEQQTYLEKTYEAFLRRGVGLPEDKKEQLKQLSLQLSMSELQFSQNVLKETNAYSVHITDETELGGLPEHQKELAKQAAQERNLTGWVFTLDAPSYRPVMTYADNRELRKKLYLAYNKLCMQGGETDNRQLVNRIVNLKREYAQILGYKSYADLALVQRMAENKQTVSRFVNRLLKAYRRPARRELQEIKDIANEIGLAEKQTGHKNFHLKPWDTAYFAHKLQLRKYNIDAEMLRPYFEIKQVIKGVFGLATRLYGITFKENRSIQVYHKDVKAYEVFDKDGTYLAVLYADFYPRATKKSGAWMTTFTDQHLDKQGNDIRPHVSITMNLTKPTKEKPALLTLGEVTTFLHEFGHALHAIFSKCRYEALSGTNVYWDFVELPSQFMENFATEKAFLRTFAFHFETGEPIPDELIDRVVKSRTMGAAMACMRQLSFCLLDMAYYTLETPFNEDIIRFEKKAWRRAMLTPQKLKTCMSTQFQHIMTGGYAAGYYCYKWAEVLDADAFSLFRETGLFNQTTARRFRNEILSKGDTEHPKILYKNYRGRDPEIKALLRRDGILS
jgi:peptidyl-dipeptidase Dcp